MKEQQSLESTSLVTPVINYRSDPHALSRESDFVRSVRAAMERYPHFVIVDDLPTDEEPLEVLNLVKLIAGNPGQPDVERIEIDPTVVASDVSKSGTSLSRTHAALPLHTDSSFYPAPYQLLVMLCIRTDPKGGLSQMLPVEDIVDNLSSEAIEMLSKNDFPFSPSKSYPVLSKIGDTHRIRYYREQIEKHLRPSQDDIRGAVDELDQLLSSLPTYDFLLTPGQAVIADNTRCLHGRTAITDDSKRLLWRIRAAGGQPAILRHLKKRLRMALHRLGIR